MQELKYIFGMAKSSYNLKGAKRPKLELDVLRLIYTIQCIEIKGEPAIGYFMIDKHLITNAHNWIEKYKFDNTKNKIIIDYPKLTVVEEENLFIEKQYNAEAINGKDKKKANAEQGQKIFENALKNKIKKDHKIECMSCTTQFGVNWDFYGEVYNS